MSTTVLVEWAPLDSPPTIPVELPSPVDPLFLPGVREYIALARRHRPTQPEDLCSECDWHWPCPVFFQARRSLITAGVHPSRWA
ncbi:MAG TPA: hypothetical protein VJT31_24610 [Rugosimonospora sp.]|nr:hypothetical protein [Rugosimonospora sp.]